MSKGIIIAIDGYSSCGKSTLAKVLAEKLNYIFIDTGAMYRAVTLHFIRKKTNLNDALDVEQALSEVNIRFQRNENGVSTLLNGENVEDEIRKMYVSEKVSLVAAISAVRRAMVRQQQQMGEDKAIVMDGRDIGTVVFPNAELKLFITADPDIRAQRRLAEIEAKGNKVDFEEVKKNLLERDRIDSSRADSPLTQAEDAIVINNSTISKEEFINNALNLAQATIDKY